LGNSGLNMFLVGEKPSASSRAGIQVFAAVPDSCVDVPSVRGERHVAGRRG
jgi:hypothetical protein